ncbi:hypothetical protein B0J13DRAFT_542335 [Dactylonectria estremocensis]|uniref:Uncharacterized protein n=1 Tax=Dactylonectria estremocensis TaxID=1079267 RepID=A0A9P9FAH3_9HYPO|nr:hypothetical protein B0J13DRAFT_542335 [Dactylonectria estremocensis]
MFLVDNEDIRDAIGIVLEGMRGSQGLSLEGGGGDIDNNPKNQFKPKLDGITNIIFPPPVTPAEPATTFSLPKTSYASLCAKDLQVYTRVRGVESEAMTTIVSRQSVSEITWTQNHSHVNQPGEHRVSGHPRVVSECSLQTHRTSTADSSTRCRNQPMCTGGFILKHYTTSENGRDVSSESVRRRSYQQNEDGDSVTGIKSFPRLLSRHCTNDWVTPHCEVGDTAQSIPDTLYHHGVDARSGSVSGILPNSPHEPPMTRLCDGIFVNNPFCTNMGHPGTSRVTEMPPVVVSQQRFGSSIGSASHRRRSSAPQSPIAETHESLLPSLMQKIRQGSHKIFHRHHSQKGSEEVATTPEEHHSGTKRRPRDSVVRQSTPEPPKPDISGIYEAMTGTRLVASRCRRGTCSEDGRPHTCENNIFTPRRAQSPA